MKTGDFGENLDLQIKKSNNMDPKLYDSGIFQRNHLYVRLYAEFINTVHEIGGQKATNAKIADYYNQ